MAIVWDWREAARDVLDALYPATCALCGGAAADNVACDLHRLPRAPEGARCRLCAAPLPPALAQADRCAACRRDSPGFASVVVLADYRAQPEIAEWLLAFKHGSRPDLAETLGRALAARWRAATGRGGDRSQLAVPVPLHRNRRLERGYDQAWLLARVVAEVAGIGCARALVRRRATVAQGSPGAVSRAANVHDAFAPARWPPRVARRVATASCVWLVDDVVTSGATARECARVLRSMGARRVGVVAVARAARAQRDEEQPAIAFDSS